MDLAAFLVFTAFSLLFVFFPMYKALAASRVASFRRDYREFQLEWIQRSYPDLRKYSWREIEKMYDIDAIYDEIARPR